MILRFANSLRRFFRDRSANALVETAIVMPVLILLLLGGIEISRYVLLHQKLSRMVSSLGDLVAQSDAISGAEVIDLFDAAEYVMAPFSLGSDGVVMVSSIADTAGTTTVNWRCNGGGSLTETSALGAVGSTATLPSGFTLASGTGVIVAEVFYNYSPWLFSGVTSATSLYYSALFRPRFGSLDALTSSHASCPP